MSTVPLPTPTQHALHLLQQYPHKFALSHNSVVEITQAVTHRWQTPHGNSQDWENALKNIRRFSHNCETNLSISDSIKVQNLSPHQQPNDLDYLKYLRQALMKLHPWRKGPFEYLQVFIDSEWQSQQKWLRITDANIDLTNKRILDIGCGNGYYAWRMLQAKARSIIGIDSSLIMHYQFDVFKFHKHTAPISLLPIRFEQLPASIKHLDIIFSMGVLYHHKQPLKHFLDIHQRLTNQGKLILETLILNRCDKKNLIPKERYAKMKNVYIIPTTAQLLEWLQQSNYRNIVIHSIQKTTTQEQRSTEWMTNQSLADFLNPQDSNQTVENHPAPTRILLEATKN